ncbi:MAG TPA: hypothetical protein VFW65_22160 [Pseudonocardiaceae bacterium]|nr:hypothetical protein [Pseudonocardiaceae bacterium]
MARQPATPPPVVLEWIDGIYVDDYCPMTCSVEGTCTHVVFGEANAELDLILPDEALSSLAELVNDAVSDMLCARGITTDRYRTRRLARGHQASTRRTMPHKE